MLKHKVALVTGGASGIGRAVALLLAREGARVVVSDVQLDAGADTVALVRAQGGEAIFVAADVGKPAEAQALVARAVVHYGRLDIAVNNAGIAGPTAPTADYPLDGWARVLNINLSGVFYGMQAQIEAMLKHGGGSIVNVCSINGQVGGAGSFSYQASKGAVRMMTKAAAMQYVKDNIRVNSICPGLVMTPMAEEEGVESNDAFAAATPMGRGARPEEVSYGVLYLACDEASYVTGTELYIDGGYTAQ